jgi:hydrogenase maturation protein HypF
MAAGILHKTMDASEWLLTKSQHLPHSRKEAELIIKQLNKGSAPETTSCGRVLDAVSAMLGVCYERSYEGEPAMKLESTAMKGKDALNLEPIIKGNVLNTTSLVHEIFTHQNRLSSADLACSTQSYLGRGLAELAVREADRLQVKHVGFSGGVAYNQHMTEAIRKVVEKRGLSFLVHKQIPAGDGGTSFGQAIAAGFQKHQ